MGGRHHHEPGYRYWAPKLRAIAAGDPDAVCWRDGLTMAEHARRHPGRQLRWTAGHTVEGSRSWRPWLDVTTVPTEGGDWLAAEVSVCNYRAGAAFGNGRRTNPTSRKW